MNDYQSIPDANDIYAESRALHITSPSPSSDAPPSSHAPSSIATQCGLVLLGFLLGYLCAALPPQTIEIGESLPRASSLSLRQSLLGPAAPPFPPPPTKPHLLYHASEPAFALLFDPKSSGDLNEYALDHFLLTSGGFDAQLHQTYCAVASVAALLNSLRYAKRGWTEVLPVDVAYDPYRYATQADVLEGECVARNVTAGGGEAGDGIRRPPYGLNLRQTVRLLQCRLSAEEWEVTMREVDPARSTLAQVRYELKAALIDPDARVLVNYDRRGLNQVGGGHFSPLGAYHAATDSFLVMDVAKYKYPPVWVGADTLMDAMGTMDDCGWYDFPGAQERLGNGSGLVPQENGEEYAAALEALGCQSRRRGYIIVKKKP